MDGNPALFVYPPRQEKKGIVVSAAGQIWGFSISPSWARRSTRPRSSIKILPMIRTGILFWKVLTIYFSGGDPGYLYQTMKDSRAWKTAQRAWERGAIYAGCSAGAMILAKRMPSFRLAGTQEGFAIVPATFIVPHFDAIPGIWKPIVFGLQRQLKKDEYMIGIDENTALIGKLNGEWIVKGKSKVQVFKRDGKMGYTDGQTVTVD